MTRYLHSLSAILFFLLGASFFAAYILHINTILADATLLWMRSADMPLLCVSLLYAGTSVYLSLNGDRTPSRLLMNLIAIPLVLLFAVSLYLKFS